MIEILEALAATVSLTDRFAKVSKTALTLDAREMLVDLRERLIEVRSQALDLVEENDRLRRALDSSKQVSQFERREDMLYEPGGDWPHCPKCRTPEGRPLALQPMPRGSSGLGTFRCNGCKGHFGYSGL